VPEFPSPSPADRCPCLSGETYGSCCGPLHDGTAAAPTAERLMRSRYSAFVVGDERYLLATWHPGTRPATLALDATVRWFGLEIVSTSRGGMLDTVGTVEFVARYRADGSAGAQHEKSSFARVDKRWVYVGEA
jgi:SEC-C motif-containing protein